jgi:hypothetical protein
MTKNTIRWVCQTCAGISLLLCSGCVTLPTSAFTKAMANPPVRSPVQIDASATVEATVTITPEAPNKWLFTMDRNSISANYRSALEQALRNDIVDSGLFARIETGSKADYAVKVDWLESKEITCALSATEMATGARITTRSRAYPGIPTDIDRRVYDKAWAGALPAFMASLKTELAENIQANARREQEQAAQAMTSLFAKASLTELITGADKTGASARERNRAIIVAKNQQLPVLLRERKTEELSTLVIMIEQSALDLNHESETAKDRAQQLTAAGGNARQIDELRGLAISYQERIELLKPIAAALKEEIANRNR